MIKCPKRHEKVMSIKPIFIGMYFLFSVTGIPINCFCNWVFEKKSTKVEEIIAALWAISAILVIADYLMEVY